MNPSSFCRPHYRSSLRFLHAINYFLSDNDLEYFLRNDNYELTQSQAVRNPSMTTWVYFDHRNYGRGTEDIFEPLQNIFKSDGSSLSGQKPTTSQYLRWDHSLQKMVVDQTLQQEQNGDDPNTVYQFLVTALRDCVAQGATEYFVVFSSHGAGWLGFGGDENTRRDQRSLAQQPNAFIVEAMTEALWVVNGAPNFYDVIGFDACLMQAVGVADDYRKIAKYILASEAVEPGHGEYFTGTVYSCA
jgi:hypothetical protein